jgi:tetratricopeptide (TPR) repeat protein
MLKSKAFLLVVAVLIGCSKSEDSKILSRSDEAERLYREGSARLESDPKKAIELLTNSLDLNPDAQSALYNRAVAFARVGRDAEAVADIVHLERIAPELGRELRAHMALSAAPYTDLATEELNAGRFDNAIKKCESALAYDPNCGDAWLVKGLALRKLKRDDQALACLNRALDVEPSNFLAYFNRAELHFDRRQLQEALRDFSKAIELRSDDEEALSRRAEVYAALGMSEKAAADKATATKLRKPK